MATRIAVVQDEEPDPEDRFIANPLDTEERLNALQELYSNLSPERARELLNSFLVSTED